MGGAAYVRHKPSQLLCHGQEDLILIIVAVLQEGDQLRAGAVFSQSQGNRAKPGDGAKPPAGVLIFQFVSAGNARALQLLAPAPESDGRSGQAVGLT
jgi:hypothetical protein